MKTLLVALLLLIVGTGTAFAECAWVLWTTRYKMSGNIPIAEVTMPSEGYKTKDECNQALQFNERREEERHKKDPTVDRYFSCLPDTVDPRGPKGK